MHGRESGSTLPLLVAVVVLLGLVSVAVGRTGGAAANRARARTAADAAALAGAAEGRGAAEALASANAARLVSFEQRGADTRVVVVVGTAEASGKARSTGPERPIGVGSTGPERPIGVGSTGPERPIGVGSTGPERRMERARPRVAGGG